MQFDEYALFLLMYIFAQSASYVSAECSRKQPDRGKEYARRYTWIREDISPQVPE